MKDRRKSNRRSLLIKVVITDGNGDTCDARAANLGLGGVCFLVTDPLCIAPEGSATFTVSCRDEKKEITIPFKVIHASAAPDFPGLTSIGVEFTHLSYKNAMILHDYLQAHHLLSV